MSTTARRRALRATATWRLPPDRGRSVVRLLAFALPMIPLGLAGWWLFDRLDLQLVWVGLALFIWWGIWIRVFLTGRSFPMELDGQLLVVYDPRGQRRWTVETTPEGVPSSTLEGTERPVGKGGHKVPMQRLTLQTSGEPLRLLRTVPAEDLDGLPRAPWSEALALEVWNGDEALFAALCPASKTSTPRPAADDA